MADNDQNDEPGRLKRTAKRARRIFMPGNPIALRPEVGTSTKWVISAIKRGNKSCPACGEGKLQIETVIEGPESERILVCDSCEASSPVDDQVQQVVGQINEIREAERKMMIFALIIIVGFGLLAYFNQNLSTFLVALFLGLALMIRSIGYRYRAWQIVNMRLFEERPPVMDWLRDEWKK